MSSRHAPAAIAMALLGFAVWGSSETASAQGFGVYLGTAIRATLIVGAMTTPMTMLIAAIAEWSFDNT